MPITQTLNLGWQYLRQIVTSDDSALSDWTLDSFPSGDNGSKTWKRPLDANTVKIAMFGTGDEDDTFSWALYAKPTVGPVELVASGTGALGAKTVVKNPRTGATITARWVDTIAASVEAWIQSISITDSGWDRIAKMSFDAAGAQRLYLEITNIGGAGEATGVAGIISFI